MKTTLIKILKKDFIIFFQITIILKSNLSKKEFESFLNVIESELIIATHSTFKRGICFRNKSFSL